jgi:hypothetical protein
MVENIQRLVGGAWLQCRTTALLYFVPSASEFLLVSLVNFEPTSRYIDMMQMTWMSTVKSFLRYQNLRGRVEGLG